MKRLRITRYVIAAVCGLVVMTTASPSLAAGTGAIHPAAVRSSQAAVGTGTGYWHAEGAQLVDSTGAPVRMTGINWFGAETSNYLPHGLWARSYQDMIDQMAGLGYNTFRLPYSDEMLKEGSTPNGVDYTKNPDLEGLTGLQILDKIIDYAGSKGMRVVLDRHRPDSAQQTPLWYTAAVPESVWIDDWKMLAQHYAGNTTVIGADLHNEPHAVQGGTGACWGCGDEATDWRLAAERAGNAILSVNPDLLIIVEGIDCVPDTGDPQCGWWGGNLSGAREYPVRLDVPGKLVYSAHEYATSVSQQPWFDDPAFPANLPALWDHFFGYLEKEDIAPVLVGEFGSTLQDPRDAQWLDALMQYMGTGTSGMDFTYWCVNPNSGDTGGILEGDWTTVDTAKQSHLDPYLIAPVAPTSTGGARTGG